MEVRGGQGSQPLPATQRSLSLGVPPAAPGTIFVLAITGGITVKPRQGRTILFGRNRPKVHVCVGEDDPKVSRQHGMLTHHRGQWRISNTGRLPLRLPGSQMLHPDDEPVPLAPGYTPMFVQGSIGRAHLLELYVTGDDGQRPSSRHSDPTQQPRIWRLHKDERLALIVSVSNTCCTKRTRTRCRGGKPPTSSPSYNPTRAGGPSESST